MDNDLQIEFIPGHGTTAKIFHAGYCKEFVLDDQSDGFKVNQDEWENHLKRTGIFRLRKTVETQALAQESETEEAAHVEESEEKEQ